MDNSDNEQDEFAELTPHQLDLLVQLQDLTGIDDLNVCRALLVSKNWDIESVAREQLGLGGSGVDRRSVTVMETAQISLIVQLIM